MSVDVATAAPDFSNLQVWKERAKTYSVLLILGVLILGLSIFAENFLTVSNWMNVLEQNAPLMLIALGTTFVMISGAFDLSTGQLLSLAGIVAVELTYATSNPVLGIALGIASGVVLGLGNGVLVGVLRINSFLATLASGLIMSGLSLYITQGSSRNLSENSTFTWIGTHRFGEIPVAVLVVLVVAVALGFVLVRTTAGRRIFLVGSNEEAARLSGISPSRLRLFAYAVGGLTAAIGGAIYMSRTGVGTAVPGADLLTLNAIAAVVIGGTSISGGKGAIWRTVAGVLILALIQNAFTLLEVEPYLQQVFSGLIILLAIWADRAPASQR